ncbi:hypothetical protein OROMI_030236 [Orobanche minor]
MVFQGMMRCGGIIKLGGRRMMSYVCKDAYRPLLMVPPLFDDSGNVANKFHCIGSDEEINYAKKSVGVGGGDGDGDIQVVGMSHGWLALYNRMSHDLCILDPISGRRVNLPPLPGDTQGGDGVSRVALSDDQNSTVMIYGGGRNLASCVPGRSKEWAPMADDEIEIEKEREYEDVIHSGFKDLFYCLTRNPTELERWKVADPESPTLVDMTIGAATIDPRSSQGGEWPNLDRCGFPWPCRSQQDRELKNKCRRIKYAVRGPRGQMYVVVRHVDVNIPYYKTVDFDVYGFEVGSKFRYMKASLDGLAFFVGNSQSSSVPAHLHPGLRPNCIYFTDDNRLMQRPSNDNDNDDDFGGGGGHDNGIFDYQNNSFSTCCGGNCPLDDPGISIKRNRMRMDHAPMWFHYF